MTTTKTKGVCRSYDDDRLKSAIRRGYCNPEAMEWNDWVNTTFIGAYLRKYPNRIKTLDLLKSAMGNQSPSWELFTDRNMRNFREILENDSRICANSRRTIFAHIKGVLNDFGKEVELPTQQHDKTLVAKKEPSQHIYLTEKELDAIANTAPISDEENYAKCLFMIAAYTGARHSDAMLLTEDNINEDNMLTYVAIKNHVEAKIPVHRNLRKYLNGYNKSISIYDYQFNDHVRAICKRAGIKTRVKVFEAGKTQIGEKWEFVASHTARRSFATNLYMRGCDIVTISKMMAHSSPTMTEKYIVGVRDISARALGFFS